MIAAPAAGAQTATSRATFPDFGISYRIPTGWTVPPESRAAVDPMLRVHFYRAGSDRAIALLVVGWKDAAAVLDGMIADLGALSGTPVARTGDAEPIAVVRYRLEGGRLVMEGERYLPVR